MFEPIAKGWETLIQAFYGLYQVGRGLKTVGAHSLRNPTTQSYPDIVPQIAPFFRGRLALTVNPETGENLCISCRQCERVCPDKCIEITAHKSPETNKLELIDFKIDHGLCMFCGLCTEVCPTNCIINTNDFEMADYTRQALIYDLKKLTLSQEESAFYFAAQEMPLPKPKPAKAAPAPAAQQEAATPAAPKPQAPKVNPAPADMTQGAPEPAAATDKAKEAQAKPADEEEKSDGPERKSAPRAEKGNDPEAKRSEPESKASASSSKTGEGKKTKTQAKDEGAKKKPDKNPFAELKTEVAEEKTSSEQDKPENPGSLE